MISSLQTSTKFDLNNQPLDIYYDLNILENDRTGLVEPQPINFNEIRNSPFIMNPGNYLMSIVRFEIDTPTLPVFIPFIQTNQGDPNLTVYSFTMTYVHNAITYEQQQYCIYQPENLSVPVPSAINGNYQTQQNIRYYYVRSYNSWMESMNKALKDCFDNLKTQVTNAGGALPTNNPPFLELEPHTLNITLSADIIGFAESLNNPIKLFMNSPMFTLLSNFQIKYFGSVASITNGKNYQFRIYGIPSVNPLNVYIINNNYSVLQTFSEGPTPVALWNPITSIVFTSTLLPIVPTNYGIPKVYNANESQLSTGNNSNLVPIITDFIVAFSATNNYKPTINYEPAGEYRWVDLMGNNPLNTIDIQVFWKDKFGNLNPVLLKNQCSASIKILFRRKDFYNVFLN